MLEKAGLNEDKEYIAANTEGFIETLKELTERLRPAETVSPDNAEVMEDTAYLAEQLQISKTACDDYDDKAAYAALYSLKQRTWKRETSAALEKIHNTLFLDSDFEGAGEQIEVLLSQLDSQGT